MREDVKEFAKKNIFLSHNKKRLAKYFLRLCNICLHIGLTVFPRKMWGWSIFSSPRHIVKFWSPWDIQIQFLFLLSIFFFLFNRSMNAKEIFFHYSLAVIWCCKSLDNGNLTNSLEKKSWFFSFFNFSHWFTLIGEGNLNKKSKRNGIQR